MVQFFILVDDAINITMILARLKQYLYRKERGPNKEHQCGVDRIPSEGQFRIILTTLEC